MTMYNSIPILPLLATIGFRRKLYADYKKDRGARDDDLVWQIQQLPYVIQSMGIPTLFVPGMCYYNCNFHHPFHWWCVCWLHTSTDISINYP